MKKQLLENKCQKQMVFPLHCGTGQQEDGPKLGNATCFCRLGGVFSPWDLKTFNQDFPWHIQRHVKLISFCLTNRGLFSFWIPSPRSLSLQAGPQSQRLVKRQIFNHWQLVRAVELGTSALPCMLKSVPWKQAQKKSQVQFGKNVYQSQLLVHIWKSDVLTIRKDTNC